MKHLGLPLFLLSLFLVPLLPFPAASSSIPEVKLKFTCLWWAPSQMEGLNPDSPPPKNTTVEIKKWEYSDPIGVPHPDSVDLVGNFVVSGTPASPYFVTVEKRWKVGPLKSANKARWEKWELSADFNLSDLKTGERKLSTIDVKNPMDTLFTKSRWPWELEVRVTLWEDNTKRKQLRMVGATLPLQPGD